MKLSDYAGHWALVTGASAGIGREFAVAFARERINLIVVARRERLLQELKDELVRDYRIQVVVVPADLADPRAAASLRTRVVADGIRIRLLCNNAAFGRWGHFEATDAATYQSMLQVNIGSVVALCHLFLPDLTGFPNSVIINVSSPAALQPVPYMSVYASTKAFVSSFGQALNGELREQGVLVQTLVPGPTESEFDTIANAYPSALKNRGLPADVVRASLAHLVRESPVASNAKGTYRQRVFAGLLPARLVINQVARMFRPPNPKS